MAEIGIGIEQIKNRDARFLKNAIAKLLHVRIKSKHRIIMTMLVLASVFFYIGMEHGAAQKTSSPSVDELLSDAKADIKSDGQQTINDSVILDSVLAAIDSEDAFLAGGDLFQTNKLIKVPQDVDSIQKAIDKAKSGSTVLVGAGQYKENIIMKDGVSVVGESAESVILDGDKKDNVVTFHGISDKNTRLENFTIKNSGENLSGILIEDSSPLINRDVISDNDYDVYIKGESSPLLQRNILTRSKAGVQIFNLSEPQNAHPIILDNVIYANKKGINVYKGDATIDHNTLSFNSAYGDSGATFGIYLSSSSADVRNNIITDNGICELCSGIYADEGSHDAKIDYNDLWNNQSNFVCFGKCTMGKNNISSDPLFEDGLRYDFSLKPESRFIKAASDGQKLGSRL